MQEALDQPLNPELIARSVQNEDEALEVYYLSCLVIDVDHFMERGYLDALAQALKIPADVKQGIESDVNEKARAGIAPLGKPGNRVTLAAIYVSG